MKTSRTFLLIASAWVLTGCVDDEGPFERVGEEIDEAAEDIRTGGNDTGDRIEDSLDEVEDAAEDAADEIEDNL